MHDNLLLQQIELEKEMVQTSVEHYRKEIEKAKQNNSFGSTDIATKLMSKILDKYSSAISIYLKNRPNTVASIIIKKIKDVDVTAFVASKIILNCVWAEVTVQSVYKSVGQAMEYEFKMRQFKEENNHYYDSIQKDLNSKCTKPNRKKTITAAVFKKRLDFHVPKWSLAEKFLVGMVLVNIFSKTTNLVKYDDFYHKNKHTKILIPNDSLMEYAENMRERLEVMAPLFLPMVCKPKEWVSVFDGGYISPYIRKNKLIKNEDRQYLKILEGMEMPIVYDAINHLQNTEWQINKRVLEVVKSLWQEGQAIAEIPSAKDEELIPFPFQVRDKNKNYTQKEKLVIKNWKRKVYEIYKRNVKRKSLRLQSSQILKIALQFEKYDKIWFPHQMDFRGRLYPIPVLLQPQGSDLAKGLLRFSTGKSVDKNSIKWLKVHGANLYGYDKESFDKRVEWIESRSSEIQSYAQNPLENRGWAKADKPFQFLAFCFEYNDYILDVDNFRTHIPVLLDGTCNGLQHYSALLRDPVGGRAVNLIDSKKPNDIYSEVASRLENALINTAQSKTAADNCKNLAKSWLTLGINRKLTKRPVMVLPYGGTMLSCREYICDYLSSNFRGEDLKKHFNLGETPAECVFKSSVWLSRYLWDAIVNTIQSATVGMSYIKNIAKFLIKKNKYIQWHTPAGLLVRQGYNSRKKKEIKTELYGNIIKTTINFDLRTFDKQRQINGICPNFIHSLDAACLMIYIVKCKNAGINSLMTVHDCYGTHACDTDLSARFLREAFVETYRQPVLKNFTQDILSNVKVDENEIPKLPLTGSLDIENVLTSNYFFN